MSTSVFLWSILAITTFWAVGAYNRLVRLRAQCLESFVPLGQHLLRYARVTQDFATTGALSSVGDSAQQLEGSPELWTQLESELEALKLLVRDFKSAHLDVKVVALNKSGNAISAIWGRMRSMPLDLAGAALPEKLVREWDENSMNVKVAIDRFNENVAVYNAAVAQFPAKMIGSFFDIKPAAQISIFNEV